MKNIQLILLSIMLWINVNAQQNPIDSLKSVLKNQTTDSGRVKLLIKISRIILAESPEEAFNYARKANILSLQANLPQQRAYSFLLMGNIYYQQAKSIEAIQSYDSAILYYKANNDKVRLSNALNNKGSVYFNQSEDDKALELFLASLKYGEEANDTLRIVTALTNIGAVYMNRKSTIDKALRYLLKSLPLAHALKDNYTIGMTCVNIGSVYLWENNDSLALKYFLESQRVLKGSADVSNSLNNIGKIYLRRGDKKTALQYQENAYEIAEKFDSRIDMVQAKMGIADVWFQSNNYQEAIKNYKLAEEIADSMHASYELSDIYFNLSKSYKYTGDYRKSLFYHEKLVSTKDSLYNLDVNKKLQGLQFRFDIEKKEGEIKLLTKNNALNQEVIKRQKITRNLFIGGFLLVLISSTMLYKQRNKIRKGKKQSDELLLNILPAEVADELKEKGTAAAKHFDNVTVLFTDFVNFTKVAETLSPQELVDELHTCFKAFDNIIGKHNIEKIKTIGDAYLAVCGLPLPDSNHPQKVVQASIEINAFMQARHQQLGNKTFEIRIGINSGSVVAGIVGVKKFAYDIWGDTVNTAARMEQHSEAGKINISGSTYELVKDQFHCEHRGKITAKGKGEIDMYFVNS